MSLSVFLVPSRNSGHLVQGNVSSATGKVSDVPMVATRLEEQLAYTQVAAAKELLKRVISSQCNKHSKGTCKQPALVLR